jgi:hypothetical protein
MAVAVLALIFGILGLLASCTAVAFLPFQSQMQGALNPPSGPGAPPMAKLQSEMQAAMNQATEKYFVGQVITSLTHLVLAACMVVGGAMILGSRPRGRTFLMYTLIAVIVFEVLRAVFMLVIQLEIIPITTTFVERMAQEGGPGNPAGASMASIMKGAMYFGLLVGLAWPLIKVVMYAVCARYLATPPVVAYFAGAKAK